MPDNHNPVISRRGFTLIELLVTISIGMVLLGGALAGFLSFQERRQVEAAAREVHQLYVTAKANAAARKVPPNYTAAGIGCKNLANQRMLGHEVNFASSTFTVRAVCEPTLAVYHNFQAYVLPSGISATVSTNPVRFNSLPISGQMTNLPVDSTVEISRGGTLYRFSISRSGAISNVQQISL